LTELGKTLVPVLQHLEIWAEEHADELLATRQKKEESNREMLLAVELATSAAQSVAVSTV
ncbi:hypothetical protein ABTF10_19150, partial [Acinetobacter baumannii]